MTRVFCGLLVAVAMAAVPAVALRAMAWQAEKQEFDLLIIPNAGHGFGAASNYVMVQRWNYFVKHLLDAEPPRNYVVPAAPATGGRRGGGPGEGRRSEVKGQR